MTPRRVPTTWTALLAAFLCAAAHAADIIAHRGGYALAPENTLAAFRLCEGVADWIEFDVRQTADGHLVVIHDETVTRTTDGTGRVDELTLAQIKALDAGSWFAPVFAGERIPTLAEALRHLPPGTRALVERKSGPPEAYIEVFRAENAASKALLGSYDWNFIPRIRHLAPEIRIFYVSPGPLTPDNMVWRRSLDAVAVAIDKAQATPEQVELVQSFGLKYFAWAFDGFQPQDFPPMGLDGFVCNDPHLVRALLLQALPQNTRIYRDLVAHWKLDDGLFDTYATTASDSVGSSPGRLVGFGYRPDWLARERAKRGGGLKFDGAAAYVRIPATPPLDLATNALTLSLWLQLDRLPSQLPQPFAGIYDADPASYALRLDRQAKGLRFIVTDTNQHSASLVIPESLLQTGTWHHVAGVYDGGAGPAAGRTLLYLDGRLIDMRIGADTSPGRGLTNAILPGQVAALGRQGTFDRHYLPGALDDVAIWRRPLSPAEIRYLRDFFSR